MTRGLPDEQQKPKPVVDDGLSEADVRAWLERSCAAQGIPVLVSDGAVLRRIATLFGAAEGGALGKDAKSTSPMNEQDKRAARVNPELRTER